MIEVCSTCNVPDLEPVLSERAWGRDLRVELRPRRLSGSLSLWDLDEVENEWSVRLGQGLPMDLALDIGLGEAQLDLGGVPLTSVVLDVSAAEVHLDFSRPNPERMRRMEIDAGITEFTLSNLGNARCEHLRLDASMGEFVVDLGGEWTSSCKIVIDGSMGDVELRVPEGLAVCVDCDTTFADVEAPRFRDTSRGWLSPAVSHDRAVMVVVEVEMSLGDIRLVSTTAEAMSSGS